MDTKADTRKTKETATETAKQQAGFAPPEGFMTGDEFERRVKERLKQLYKEHGLLSNDDNEHSD
jgi:hypothetical protein